tara:strand:- start:315 stop:494 length:180 start_codon:yes stop_codon:yes gene_type:complete
MKEYEIEVTSTSYFTIKEKNWDKAEELANYLYDSGELFEMKEIDRGSEITSVTEIKGVK